MNVGELHPELQANLGKGFDERASSFVGVPYESIRARVGEGGSDDEILVWCFENGTRPKDEQIEIWNNFMIKRGWNDELTEKLIQRKKESGFESRNDIQTMFQYIDADERRL
jgi:gluconokinase